MRMTGPIAGADRIADRANRESSGDPHPSSASKGCFAVPRSVSNQDYFEPLGSSAQRRCCEVLNPVKDGTYWNIGLRIKSY